jgi:hypothetical protein
MLGVKSEYDENAIIISRQFSSQRAFDRHNAVAAIMSLRISTNDSQHRSLSPLDSSPLSPRFTAFVPSV